ncbi:MAG TPA: hypothetical protein VN081_02155 [Dongiaceae bacterium]|nr:hypothetical protein [Dongiaceae bacterium]
MSIASNFRAKMDVALKEADKTVGMNDDARRTCLLQAFDRADLILIEKSMIAALMEAANKMNQP